MITLDEVLKKDEEEYIIPPGIKERILTNILEQIYSLAIQTDNDKGKYIK